MRIVFIYWRLVVERLRGLETKVLALVMDRLHRVSMKNAACCVNYHELQTLRVVNFRTHSTVGFSRRYVWFRVVSFKMYSWRLSSSECESWISEQLVCIDVHSFDFNHKAVMVFVRLRSTSSLRFGDVPYYQRIILLC